MRSYTVFFMLLFTNLSMANVSLPSIYADHMVLQQNSEVKLWGWGNPTEQIAITNTWNADSISTQADRYAKWTAILKTPKAGGPYTITIKGYNEISLKDILIGEVWVCSGQSNMEWSAAAGIDNTEETINNADFPQIRLFNVVKKSAESPQDNVSGEWQVCTPNTMKYFSAIGYFFGKRLHENLNVPIGLVNSSWGGTPAEIWMPKETIESDQELLEASKKLTAEQWGPNEPGRAYNAMIAPLTQTKIAGVIWYQGETNTSNPHSYNRTFSALINSWRAEWNNDFPFYYVQIAPFNYETPEVGVKVRDAQRTTLQVKKTGMAVISDIGNINDIHPKNKTDVGLRLANIALKRHYKSIEGTVESPILRSASLQDNRVVLSFENSAGLHFKSDALLFEIAGEDNQFFLAKANIKNNEVILSSKKVPQPRYIRFAWGNTSISNLFNEVGLPASSFLIDINEK